MEAAGLAVGAVSLAGIFSACVDCFHYVQSGKNYEYDTEILMAKFHVQHVRLYLWGHLVGLTQETDSESHEMLAEQRFGVRRCLEGIRQALTMSSDLIEKYGLIQIELEDTSGNQHLLPSRADKLRSSLGSLLPEVKPTGSGPSVLSRAKWSFCDKGKFIDLLEDLKDFIDGLHSIVPAIQPRHNRLVQRGIESVRDSEALELVIDATEKDYPGTLDG